MECAGSLAVATRLSAFKQPISHQPCGKPGNHLCPCWYPCHAVMPPAIVPPFLFGNFVDCVGWSQKLYRYSEPNRPCPSACLCAAHCINGIETEVQNCRCFQSRLGSRRACYICCQRALELLVCAYAPTRRPASCTQTASVRPLPARPSLALTPSSPHPPPVPTRPGPFRQEVRPAARVLHNLLHPQPLLLPRPLEGRRVGHPPEAASDPGRHESVHPGLRGIHRRWAATCTPSCQLTGRGCLPAGHACPALGACSNPCRQRRATPAARGACGPHPSRPPLPCRLPAAACIRPSATCVSGSYTVQTPGGPGCLSCFDTNVAVGPKCYYKGTVSCTQTTCTCNGQYKG